MVAFVSVKRSDEQRKRYEQRKLLHICVRCSMAASDGVIFCERHAALHAASEKSRTAKLTNAQRELKRIYQRQYKRELTDAQRELRREYQREYQREYRKLRRK